MAQIIHFQERTPEAKRGQLLARWALEMGYGISPRATLADIPDRLLLALAESDPRGESLLEELVCLLLLGKKQAVTALPPQMRMRILEFSLLLLDLVRFECMARLHWIEPQAARQFSLVGILSKEPGEFKGLKEPAGLTKDHPHFHKFQALPMVEREAFVRRMIPQALELFRRRLTQSC